MVVVFVLHLNLHHYQDVWIFWILNHPIQMYYINPNQLMIFLIEMVVSSNIVQFIWYPQMIYSFFESLLMLASASF